MVQLESSHLICNKSKTSEKAPSSIQCGLKPEESRTGIDTRQTVYPGVQHYPSCIVWMAAKNVSHLNVTFCRIYWCVNKTGRKWRKVLKNNSHTHIQRKDPFQGQPVSNCDGRGTKRGDCRGKLTGKFMLLFWPIQSELIRRSREFCARGEQRIAKCKEASGLLMTLSNKQVISSLPISQHQTGNERRKATSFVFCLSFSLFFEFTFPRVLIFTSFRTSGTIASVR